MPTLSIDWERSPRIIIVDAPDTEISAQQIVDLCRDAEDDPANADDLKLVNAAGKEDLGGGTSVGITLELQNAKIGFEDRTNKLENGTVTTSDATGVVLEDSAATFVTNLVEIGDLVVNTTDGSHATVIEVTSETGVRTTGLSGGVDNQFASSDAYEVWEIIPCEVTGGNVVAVDDLGAALEPLLPTFGVYAIISKASTGTLQEQGDIQHASFDGGVHVDVTSSNTGSAYPSGNSANPVNNWADASVINIREGFDKYFVEKSTTLDVAENYDDAKFEGRSVISTVLTIPVGSSISKAEFFFVSLEGTLGDTTIIRDCFLGETNSVENVQGRVERSSIGPAEIIIGGPTTETVYFTDCRGAGEDVSPVTISGNGNGPKLDMQNHTGTLILINKTGDAFWDVQINGDVTVDSTCTAGIIRVTGVGSIVDNSGIGCTVLNQILDPVKVTDMWKVQGLERGNAMTVTPTLRSTSDGSISLALTGDGVTSTTVTRQTDTTITLDAPLTSSLLDNSGTNATPIFTRADSANYIDSISGLLVSAATDVARFEANGVLLEKEITNEFIQTEDFSTSWAVSQSAINTDVATAPDGNATADQLIDNNAGGTGVCLIIQNRPLSVDTQYTFSLHGEPNGLDWMFMDFNAFTGSGDPNAYYDLTNGVIGTVDADTDATSIKSVSSGYRCSMTGTLASDASGNFRIAVAEADNDRVVDRDGTSSINIWGAQLEDGAFPTSYKESTTTPSVRPADFLSYDTDEIIIDAAGSIYVEITPLFRSDTSNDAVIVNIANQLIGPLYITDDTTQKVAISDGTNVATYDPTFVAGTTYKIASRWNASLNEMQIIVNGVAGAVQPYSGAFTRALGTLYVGSAATGFHLNGNMKNLKVYGLDKGEDQLKVDTG